MADQLFLSYWLRNYSDATMLRNYEKLLRLFPFSRLGQQASTFKIMAVDVSEPVVAEIPYPPPVPMDDVLAVAKDFQNPDSSYRLETWWDLWQFNDEWKLAPARVALCCFGPEFNQSPSGAAGTRAPASPCNRVSRSKRRRRHRLRARNRIWDRCQFSSAARPAR